MDASDIIRKKQARVLASIQKDPENAIARGQTPNNPPLTPDQRTFITSQYPQSQFANTNSIYPCGSNTLCSTIYSEQYYYNATNNNN